MSQKPNSADKKPIRSFGRRKSKNLRPTRERSYAEILPQMQIVLPEGTTKIDPSGFFSFQAKEIHFEIGFGNGEHLAAQALKHPEIGFIGCEPFMNGVAALCVTIKEENIQNIRLWPDDARLLMARLKDSSLDRLYLLHPDPWPKTRHHKRRFVQPETLDDIHRLLKNQGEFRTATDHSALAAWMLEKTYFHQGFDWTAREAQDWRAPPETLQTRYQAKGLKAGRPPIFLNFLAKK